MTQNASTHRLAQELFQLFKRLPHMKLNVNRIRGLTNSEHELLVVLRFNTTGEKAFLSASEITDILHITSAGGTHLFNPLEKAGYITRIPDPKDRRITLVGLTEKGMETTDLLLADLHAQFGGLVRYLGEEDSQALIRLATKAFDYFASQAASLPESGNGRQSEPTYS